MVYYFEEMVYLVHSQSVDNSLVVFQNSILLTQSTQEFLYQTGQQVVTTYMLQKPERKHNTKREYKNAST